LAIKRLELPNSVLTAYCIIFAIFGSVAIFYSLRISFAGSTLPNKGIGDGTRPIFCASLPSCQESEH
jgi:hypothetical protein